MACAGLKGSLQPVPMSCPHEVSDGESGIAWCLPWRLLFNTALTVLPGASRAGQVPMTRGLPDHPHAGHQPDFPETVQAFIQCQGLTRASGVIWWGALAWRWAHMSSDLIYLPLWLSNLCPTCGVDQMPQGAQSHTHEIVQGLQLDVAPRNPEHQGQQGGGRGSLPSVPCQQHAGCHSTAPEAPVQVLDSHLFQRCLETLLHDTCRLFKSASSPPPPIHASAGGHFWRMGLQSS